MITLKHCISLVHEMQMYRYRFNNCSGRETRHCENVSDVSPSNWYVVPTGRGHPPSASTLVWNKFKETTLYPVANHLCTVAIGVWPEHIISPSGGRRRNGPILNCGQSDALSPKCRRPHGTLLTTDRCGVKKTDTTCCSAHIFERVQWVIYTLSV